MRLRTLRVAVVPVALLLVAACAPISPPPPAAPVTPPKPIAPLWPGTPPTPPPPTAECREIVVIGDSMAFQLEWAIAEARQFEKAGYCVNLRREAVRGASACVWAHTRLEAVLAKYPTADAYVAHFVGLRTFNGTPGCTDTWSPALATQEATSMRVIRDAVTATGIPLFTLIPSPSDYACDPGHAVSGIWRSYAAALAAQVPDVHEIDLRSSFGPPDGRTYSASFRFVGAPTAALRTDTIPAGLDCLHYTVLGMKFMANIVRAAVAGIWTVPARGDGLPATEHGAPSSESAPAPVIPDPVDVVPFAEVDSPD